MIESLPGMVKHLHTKAVYVDQKNEYTKASMICGDSRVFDFPDKHILQN